MMKFLFGVAALLVLATTVACSQTAVPSVASTPTLVTKAPARYSQTVPGSYIVTAPGDGTAAVRRIFAQYGVVQVNPLGNNQFELRLQRDPGLDALTSLIAGSSGAVTAIQPNFVYHVY
jgi:hypothetical protein